MLMRTVVALVVGWAAAAAAQSAGSHLYNQANELYAD